MAALAVRSRDCALGTDAVVTRSRLRRNRRPSLARLVFFEEFVNLCMPMKVGIHERQLLVKVGQIGIRTVLEKSLNNASVALGCCRMQRRPAVLHQK